ncbi:hypothetical protein [Paenibacillus selenitireducens]|uniref:hypothetical protein n=1 Tax=Paenibacillus selenitireducens TaxID=1324314 RepID=UPI00117BE7E1|nr:hypothetical protein [Paenibacillus selenitireducens]
MEHTKLQSYLWRALKSGGTFFLIIIVIIVLMSDVQNLHYQLLFWSVASIFWGLLYAWRVKPIDNSRQLSSHTNLVRDKKKFTWAIVGLVVLSLLTIRFPHDYTWFEWILNGLHIKTVLPLGNGTLILTGLPLIICLIIFIQMLARSLHRRRLLIGFIAFLIVTSLPNKVVSVYQQYFASGMYALQTDKTTSQCSFEPKGDNWFGHCRISLYNHSQQPVTAKVVLKSKYGFSYGYDEVQLGTVTFQPGYNSSIEITDIEMPKAPNQVVTGQFTSSYNRMNVYQGTQVREL